MLAVPDAKKYFDKNVDFVITGNPVRQEILTAKKEESRKELGLDNRPVVLSFGGSLGARKINEAVADLVARSGIDADISTFSHTAVTATGFRSSLRKRVLILPIVQILI